VLLDDATTGAMPTDKKWGDKVKAHQLIWTEMTDKYGTTMTAIHGTWPEMVDRLRNVGAFPSKDKCPWIKGASFGDIRTPIRIENGKKKGGSLRHDGNVLAVYAIEGDYDGEEMTMDEAVAKLEHYGIRAALYPSPSSRPNKPRWRVIAPLSRAHSPHERARLVARLNGALGGVLANESFTLSQGYFFGATPTNGYDVLKTFDDPEEGSCIDELSELDKIAIGKTAGGLAFTNRPNASGERAPIGAEMFRLAVEQKGRLLVTGDGRREMLKTYIASRSARRMPADDIRLLVSVIAAMFFDPADPLDTKNIDDIVRHFQLKDLNPHVGSSGLLGNAGTVVDADTGEIIPPAPMFKPVSVLDVLSSPAQPPQFVWDGYLPRGVVTLMGAHGGTGKSTIALMLAVCTALGRPLFGVATKSCNVLFASLEDGMGIVRHRLASICTSLLINPAELEGKLHIVDGTENPELFSADHRGAGNTTQSYAELSELALSVSAGLVIVDNASDAYGGDEIQRRQVRAFLRSLVLLANSADCAVLLLAHVDKNTSKARRAEGGEGYSGSTAWHNSARSRLFMTRNDSGGLTLEHQKSNLGLCRETLALEWPDAGLPQLLAINQVDNPLNPFLQRLQGRAEDERAISVLRMIAEFESRQQYCSPVATARNNVYATLKSEPVFQKLKLNADACKRIVTQCQRAKWIESVEYRTHDRKTRLRWTLTSVGRAIAGLPALSAPCAPCAVESAESAEGAGGAPCAPSCAGGVGGERARLAPEEDALTDSKVTPTA